MPIIDIVVTEVSKNLRQGTYEQVGASISLPIAMLSEEIRLKSYGTWDPLSVIMILDFIYSAAWLARRDEIDSWNGEVDNYFNLSEARNALNSGSELREEYENFMIFSGFESQTESYARVSRVLQGDGTLNIMKSAFVSIIRSVSRDLNVYFHGSSFSKSVEETKSRILELVRTTGNPLMDKACSCWEVMRLPAFFKTTVRENNIALHKVSIIDGFKRGRTRIYEENNDFKHCSFRKDDTEEDTMIIVEGESKASILRMMLCLLPRSVWTYGKEKDCFIISIAEDIQENAVDVDVARNEKVRKLQSNLVPVEGGILILNLQRRRIILVISIGVSAFMSSWTVYRREGLDWLTVISESIEIFGALLAFCFVLIKIFIEDDRAVINCFRAREKVVTDMRLKTLLKDQDIRDLKAVYAGKARRTRQIFRERNYSICVHPATDEGIASETKLSIKDLLSWKYSIFGAILVTCDSKVAVLDICNEEENTTRDIPDHYVSYDLENMTGRILRRRLHEDTSLC